MMPTQTVNSLPMNQQNIERIVDRILMPLRTKPDTGIVMVVQSFQQQPEEVRLALLRRMATRYATTDSEHYKRLEAENKRLKQPPHQLAILDEVRSEKGDGRLARVQTHEGLLEVQISQDMSDEDLVPGSLVALSKNGAIIAARGLPLACPATVFSRQLSDGRILAGQGGQHIILRPNGDFLNGEDPESLKPGDLIEYEPSTQQAVRLAEHSVKTREFVGEAPDVCWDDIGGLNNIRSKIEEEVLGPSIHRQAYEPYGVHPPRGILFEGPPGVGKTLLAKATGKSLLTALKLKDDAPVLFRVKGTALQSSYVGEGPARIRALAATAREVAEEHGLALIVLDDFEYGGGLHRGIGDRSSPAYSALSSALISEMDGIDARGSRVVWVATVNRGDLLDGALLRPGRFSQKIQIPRPDPEACLQILLVHLRGVPIAERRCADELAEQAIERLFSYDDENLLMRLQYAEAGVEEVFPPRVISGAILAEAVRGAALQAIRRDRANGTSEPGGIRSDDLCKSLYSQLNSVISTVTPSNAHLHYLNLADDQRVVAVEHVWTSRHGSGEA